MSDLMLFGLLKERDTIQSFFRVPSKVANITDFSIEVRNSENDPYFSRFLYGVLKFSDFLRILKFSDFFQHFLPIIGNHPSCGALA